MIPAPGAGSEGTKKKRKRRRPANRAPQTSTSGTTPTPSKKPARPYAKRVDEVSAGGLVIDKSGLQGLLIGRRDQKDPTGKKLLWSLPKGHIEEGETPEQAAIREVAEETGIDSQITQSLGVIDFWFQQDKVTIHKTVHHFLILAKSGELVAQEGEVDEIAWVGLDQIAMRLTHDDEKQLISKAHAILSEIK